MASSVRLHNALHPHRKRRLESRLHLTALLIAARIAAVAAIAAAVLGMLK